MPYLYTYEGQKFAIGDIIGTFDWDEQGIIFKSDQIAKGGINQVVLLDKFDWLVNSKGYLIDKDNNIINRQGEIVINQKYINE